MAGVLPNEVSEPVELGSRLPVEDGTKVRVVVDDEEPEVVSVTDPVDEDEPEDGSLLVAEPSSVGVARLLGLCVKLMRSLVSETGAAAPPAPAETDAARSLAVPHPNCE